MTADGKRRRSGSSCPDSRKASTAASRQYEAIRPHLTAGVQSILEGYRRSASPLTCWRSHAASVKAASERDVVD